MAKRVENILILGLGGVGLYLAKRLSHEEHAITIIESNRDGIRQAEGEIDARLIHGDAMSFSCWREAEAEKMDYLIAVTDNDAVNILAAQIGHRCGINRKIARVRSLELWEPNALLGPDDLNVDLVIRPGELTALEIARLLKMRAGNVVVDLAEGHMQVMATRIGRTSALSRMTVKDIAKKYDNFFFRIVAVARGIDTFIPSGDDKLLPQDHVFILAHSEDLPQLMELAGVSERKRHRVMILGGGLIGTRVAELLEDAFPVRLIEQNERRAEELAHRLKKTEVLCGDGSDSDTLVQAGVIDMDTIIAATNDNETNIMTSVLAKHLIRSHSGHGDDGGKTIALVKREAYLVLASAMGADVVLNKKVLAGHQILKYIRRGKLLSVANLHGCDAEVVELVADAGAPITRKSLAELRGRLAGVIIGGVFRDETWEVAVGSTHIQPGEKVIAICRSRTVRDLQTVFLAWAEGPVHYRAIANVFGTLLLVTGGAMLLPVVCSLIYGEDDLVPLLVGAAVAGGLGFPLRWLFRKSDDLEIRDSFILATFGWVVISAVSAIPFMLHGSIPSFTDAFFEMMSGYTTTGSTILTDIEVVPHGLLFWRSETHLLGGMGFLTLTVMFLPHGMGGLRIFRAESSPGQVITRERFTPRNRDAMYYLWVIYLSLNALQVILMCAGGMSLFDSLCHAFGTVSTSGYSPYNASIGHYDSAYFDWVIIVFMFLGGVTFMLFYHLMLGHWRVLRINTELRWYLGFVVVFCGAVFLILWQKGTYGPVDSLRFGTFQVMSLLTTTGFSTADYELWPQSAQMFLFVICFVGACAGSTTSGIKIIHYVLIWKFMVGNIKKIFFQPLTVVSIRVNERPIDTAIVTLAVCYFIVNIFMILAGGCVMTLSDDIDFMTGMSSIIAALMNIGPGFGDVGPSENFAFFSDFGKWFLSFNMLVGRLEMFSALVIFYPSFWRR